MSKNTLESVSASLEKLSREQSKIHQLIKDAMLPGIRYTIENNWVRIDTSYHDEYASHQEKCQFFGNSLAKRIAFEIQDYDFPTSQRDAKRFCEFMGFSQEGTAAILAACSSDEQYDRWANEERRAYAY